MAGLTRRTMLQLSAAAGVAGLFAGTAKADAPDGLKLAEPEPFSFDWLKRHARDLAGQPYQAPPRPDPEVVQRIDYDAHGSLDYRMDYALFPDSAYPISFQHVGMYFPKTVRMHKLTGDVDARGPSSPRPSSQCRRRISLGQDAGRWHHLPAESCPLFKEVELHA